jgi:hypothetical protein
VTRRVVRIQPDSFIDNLWGTTDEGMVEGRRLPYPFFVTEKGEVLRQDIWAGKVLKVVGFQRDLAKNQIDLWWHEAFVNPDRCLGMYVVTRDRDGGMSVHTTAISEYEVLTADDEET